MPPTLILLDSFSIFSIASVVSSSLVPVEKVINNNLKNIGIDNAKVLNMDYKKAIETLKEKFDIIFLDPPYKTNYIEEAIKLITKYDILSNEGIIVCESDSLDRIIYDDNYKAIKDKKYGDKYIVILKKVC